MTETEQVRLGAIGAAAGKYPLFEHLLATKGLRDKGLWTNGDVAAIFEVSPRTIQQWGADGKLRPRDLPGRAKFLSEDLEEFLRSSARAIGRDGI